MRAFLPYVAIVTGTALLAPSAFADDAARQPSERSARTGPACCNPAAADRPPAKRAPGDYVGMPLKPGDLGYNPKAPEK